ncbi:MAG: hypothetical protein Q4A10_00885 [Aerococcaceae bacterium]|nr:hypothetical protein [Aerococcaceae bacterium]
MARKQANRQQKQQGEALVQVDIYMIPAPLAEMYRVLREAVATDLIAELERLYPIVKRVPDDIEGESVVAYDIANLEQWRYYLSPTNLSNAQKARDKEQFDKYLASLGLPIEIN